MSRVSASYPCCDRWKVLVRLLPLTWQMVRSRLPPTPALLSLHSSPEPNVKKTVRIFLTSGRISGERARAEQKRFGWIFVGLLELDNIYISFLNILFIVSFFITYFYKIIL